MPSTPDDDVALVRLVRLRIADMGDAPLLDDDSLQILLDAHGGNAWRASADALRTIAASEVLVSKAIRTQDLQTNGDRVAESLRKLAADYDHRAEEEEGRSTGGFFVVPAGPVSDRLETEEHRT